MSTEEDLAVAREVTRELHAAIKDARLVLRDLNASKDDLISTIAGVITGAVDDALEVRTTQALKDYETTVLGAVDRATAAVYQRFDMIADVLLCEDKKAKREGKPSLVEIAQAIRTTARLQDE